MILEGVWSFFEEKKLFRKNWWKKMVCSAKLYKKKVRSQNWQKNGVIWGGEEICLFCFVFCLRGEKGLLLIRSGKKIASEGKIILSARNLYSSPANK